MDATVWDTAGAGKHLPFNDWIRDSEKLHDYDKSVGFSTEEVKQISWKIHICISHIFLKDDLPFVCA